MAPAAPSLPGPSNTGRPAVNHCLFLFAELAVKLQRALCGGGTGGSVFASGEGAELARGMSLPGLIRFPADAALCWEVVKPGWQHPPRAGACPALLARGPPGSTAAARQCRRRRCELLSGPDSLGETRESVRSIANISPLPSRRSSAYSKILAANETKQGGI